jgi:glycosyltransferase involved in cell wall biosynthesis
LKENLDSICRQTYKNIEVLVSDDSPGDEVEQLVKTYRERLPVTYWHNRPSLGSPANWNAVLKKAKGEFIILLHHDDQFANDDSLTLFLAPFQHNPVLHFTFGRNEGIEKYAGSKAVSVKFFEQYRTDPALLVKGNTLGAPSNLCLRREALQLYDERFKWIVDIEYYTRLFKGGKAYSYIDEYLVKTGTHDLQVSNECINDGNILLFENLTFAIENIPRPKDISVFDFYWRLLRNNSVRSLGQLQAVGVSIEQLPSFIHKILNVQRRISKKALRRGAVSKLLMSITYVFGR